MCGIVGILGSIPSKLKMEQARDAMTHRGPDDAGLYYSPEEQVALGHRRLAIIDLSPAGHQPFFSNDKRYVLVFNGEIYNYLEIKAELEDAYQFKTKSDTEVLLAAYIKWGEQCLSKFSGMFAFAIWDRRDRKLFCARDRFGVKPFYYFNDGKNFYFASEIKALLHFKNIPRRLNKQALLDYLSYRYPLGESTLFEGIQSLLPGHYVAVKPGVAIKREKYWELPNISKKTDPGENEAIARTKELLTHSIKLRLRSDVPMGAYLSGGLDSSVLVAIMSSLSQDRIKTFSVGFPEEGFSELPYAKIVSDKFNTDHTEMTLSGHDYFDSLMEVIKFKDAPLLSPNEVPWYLLSKELKKQITVVLSGGGADELFGGYGRIFRSGFDLERLTRLENYSKEKKEILLNNLKNKYGELNFSSVGEHFLSQYSYWEFSLKQKLLNSEVFGGFDIKNSTYFEPIFSRLKSLSIEDQYLYTFQTTHLLGTLNHLDNVTMSASVEAREPYVDHSLVEYVSALPFKYKIAWKSPADESQAKLLNSNQISEAYDIPKYLLRKIAADYLPPEIMQRKKLGFPVPLDKWLRGKFGALAKEALLSSEARSRSLFKRNILEDLLEHKEPMVGKNYGLNIWMLMNVELWLREYNVVI